MLQIKRTMGPKGQVVLPKDIRDQFNLNEGAEILFIVQDNEVRIKPAMDPLKFVEDFCAPGKKIRKKPTINELRELIKEKYEDRARHR